MGLIPNPKDILAGSLKHQVSGLLIGLLMPGAI